MPCYATMASKSASGISWEPTDKRALRERVSTSAGSPCSSPASSGSSTDVEPLPALGTPKEQQLLQEEVKILLVRTYDGALAQVTVME